MMPGSCLKSADAGYIPPSLDTFFLSPLTSSECNLINKCHSLLSDPTSSIRGDSSSLAPSYYPVGNFPSENDAESHGDNSKDHNNISKDPMAEKDRGKMNGLFWKLTDNNLFSPQWRLAFKASLSSQESEDAQNDILRNQGFRNMDLGKSRCCIPCDVETLIHFLMNGSVNVLDGHGNDPRGNPSDFETENESPSAFEPAHHAANKRFRENMNGLKLPLFGRNTGSSSQSGRKTLLVRKGPRHFVWCEVVTLAFPLGKRLFFERSICVREEEEMEGGSEVNKSEGNTSGDKFIIWTLPFSAEENDNDNNKNGESEEEWDRLVDWGGEEAKNLDRSSFWSKIEMTRMQFGCTDVQITAGVQRENKGGGLLSSTTVNQVRRLITTANLTTSETDWSEKSRHAIIQNILSRLRWYSFRSHHRRGEDVSRLRREEMVRAMAFASPMTEEEERIVKNQLKNVGIIWQSGGKLIEGERHDESPLGGGDSDKNIATPTTPTPTPTPSVNSFRWKRLRGGGRSLEVQRYIRFDPVESTAFVKGHVQVHSSAETILAWVRDCCSYERLLKHQRSEGNLTMREYTVPLAPGMKRESHSNYVVTRKAMPKGITTREMNVQGVWEKCEGGVCVYCYEPTKKLYHEIYVDENDQQEEMEKAEIGRSTALASFLTKDDVRLLNEDPLRIDEDIDIRIGHFDGERKKTGGRFGDLLTPPSPSRKVRLRRGSKVADIQLDDVMPKPNSPRLGFLKKMWRVNAFTSPSESWSNRSSRSHRTRTRDWNSGEDVVQLRSSGAWIIRPLSPSVSSVTLVLNIVDMGSIPSQIINLKMGSNLKNILEDVKTLFEIQGGAVDDKIRQQFVSNMRMMPEPPSNDAARIATKLIEFFDLSHLFKRQLESQEGTGVNNTPVGYALEDMDSGWEPAEKASSQRQKMRTYRKVNPRDSRAPLLGCLSYSVDTSPEMALAWFWDFCSHERKGGWNLNDSREVMKTSGRDYQVISTTFDLPWPANKRTVIFEMGWREFGGKFVVAWEETTYGEGRYPFSVSTTEKNIGGKGISGLIIIEKASPSISSSGIIDLNADVAVDDRRCLVTKMIDFDLKGGRYLKRWVNKKLPYLLRADTKLTGFPRYKNQDNNKIQSLSRLMKGDKRIGCASLTSREANSLASTRDRLNHIISLRQRFRAIPSTDGRTQVHTYEMDGKFFILAEVRVDNSAEQLCARAFFEKQCIIDRNKSLIEHHVFNEKQNAHVLEAMNVGYFASGVPRMFLIKRIWERHENNTLTITSFDLDDGENSIDQEAIFREVHLSKSSVIRVKAAMMQTFEPMEVCHPQFQVAKLTYVVELNLDETLQNRTVAKNASIVLERFIDLRQIFSLDHEIDRAKRIQIMLEIDGVLTGKYDYTSDERLAVQRANDLFRLYVNDTSALSLSLSTQGDFRGKAVILNNRLHYYVSTTVACTPEEAISFLLDVSSRSLCSAEDVGDKVCVDKDEENRHTKLLKIFKVAYTPQRTKVNRMIAREVVWMQIEKNNSSLSTTKSIRNVVANIESNLAASPGLKYRSVRLPVTSEKSTTQSPPSSAAAATYSGNSYMIYQSPSLDETFCKVERADLIQNQKSNHDQSAKKRGSISLTTTFRPGKISNEPLPLLRDKSICAMKIVPVSDGFCTVETLFDSTRRINSARLDRRLDSFGFGRDRSWGYDDDSPLEFVCHAVFCIDLKSLKLYFSSFFRKSGVNVKQAEEEIKNLHDYNMLAVMKRHFQSTKRLPDLNGRDGEYMAKMLMNDFSGLLNANMRTNKMVRKRLERFFAGFTSMRRVQGEHLFFEVMLKTILSQNSVTTTLRIYEKKQRIGIGKLENLVGEDGKYFGLSFLALLSKSTTEEGAYDAWIALHPALKSFQKVFPPFRTFMVVLGAELNHAATRYKFFLSLGASLFSLVDVGSDVYVYFYYTSNGKETEAILMMAFVSLGISLQLIFCIAVHHRNKRRMFSELLHLLTFTKHALNFWSVLTNSEPSGHELIPAVTEMMGLYACEMFAESIPSSVLQVRSLLDTEKNNFDPFILFSLGASVFLTSYGIAYMSFMMDSDKRNRKLGEDITYGFMPESGAKKHLVLFGMRLLCSCCLLAKCLTIAMLMKLGGKDLAMLVIFGELLCYFIYKVVRRDVRYYLPLPRMTSILGSIVFRAVMKVVSDFTGLAYARHPLEMGGLYWVLNLIYTQISCVVVAVFLERQSVDSNDGDTMVISGSDFVVLAVTVFFFFVVALTLIIAYCEKEFRGSFYSSMTAKQYCCELFCSSDDEVRMTIFDKHRTFYTEFENDVKIWLKSRWLIWHSEKPEWFSESIADKVPIDLVPGIDTGLYAINVEAPPPIVMQEIEGGIVRRGSRGVLFKST